MSWRGRANPKAVQSCCWKSEGVKGQTQGHGCWGPQTFSTALLISLLLPLTFSGKAVVSSLSLSFMFMFIYLFIYFYFVFPWQLQACLSFYHSGIHIHSGGQGGVSSSHSVAHASVWPAYTNLCCNASRLQGKFSQGSHDTSDITHHNFGFLNRTLFTCSFIRWKWSFEGKKVLGCFLLFLMFLLGLVSDGLLTLVALCQVRPFLPKEQ